MEKRALKISSIGDKISIFIQKLAKVNSLPLAKYSEFVLKDNIYRKIRTLTRPLHKIWIWAWLNSLYREQEQYPFNKPGVYIICGEPGAGKSSLAFEIMTRTLKKTGKGSYINTAIENPKVNSNTFQTYLYHPKYQLTDFFQKGKILKWPNQYKFSAIHIDEIHRELQYRQNQSSEYMDIFKGLMEYAVGIRHYIGHMFCYTQMDKVDTQMMSLGANNILNVQIKKGFNYRLWLETGKFEITILGWNLSFYIATQSGGTWNKVKTHETFLKRTFCLEEFNTYNLRKNLKDVEFDKSCKTSKT